MIEIPLADMMTVVTTFLLVMGILALCYFFTKKVGKGMLRYQTSSCMKVIDRVIIGQDKSLMIVQIGERYCLIGVAQSGIQLLMELSKEEVEMQILDKEKNQNFTEMFSEKFKRKNRQ